VAFDRGVEKLFDAGEVDDLVELAVHFCAGHAEDGAVEVDVLAAAEFGVKSGADLEQAGDAAAEDGASGSGFGDTAEELEEGALAGAVAADDAEDFAFVDGEGNIAQGPEVALVLLRELSTDAQPGVFDLVA